MHITRVESEDTTYVVEQRVEESFIDGFMEYLSSFNLSSDQKGEIFKLLKLRFEEILPEMLYDTPVGNNYNPDAYGNDAEYWHDQYESLLSSKELIDSKLQAQVRTLSSNFTEIQKSRDAWKRKYYHAKRDYDLAIRGIPAGFRWPELPNGDLIIPGMRVKSKESGEAFYVDVICYDGTCMVALDANGKSYLENELDVPDPETEISILKELAPELTEDQIISYLERLDNVEKKDDAQQVD